MARVIADLSYQAWGARQRGQVTVVETDATNR
jgi:hypothetical protein